jgi:hypothetical protein
MTPMEIEPTVLAAKRKHTYSLDHGTTGTNLNMVAKLIEIKFGICTLKIFPCNYGAIAVHGIVHF